MDGGGAVLSPWSAATMQDPHQWVHLTPDLFYGYGIFTDRYQELEIRQHGGNVTGFGTYLLWVPERRFAVALLTNVTSSLIDAAYCIVDEVLEPEPLVPPDLTTDPSTWDRYEGRYLITETEGEEYLATVSRRGGQLFAAAELPDLPGVAVEFELIQAFLDTFVFDGDGDGLADTDVTFCDTHGQPGIVMWTRNRGAVGERQLVPREAGRRLGP
jgi:CubicO group peptidase (beta-lactamase class C family)